MEERDRQTDRALALIFCLSRNSMLSVLIERVTVSGGGSDDKRVTGRGFSGGGGEETEKKSFSPDSG